MSAIAGRWHLIQKGGQTELLDLVSDPAEARNVMQMPPDLAAARVVQSIEREKQTRTREDSRGFRSLGYIR